MGIDKYAQVGELRDPGNEDGVYVRGPEELA